VAKAVQSMPSLAVVCSATREVGCCIWAHRVPGFGERKGKDASTNCASFPSSLRSRAGMPLIGVLGHAKVSSKSTPGPEHHRMHQTVRNNVGKRKGHGPSPKLWRMNCWIQNYGRSDQNAAPRGHDTGLCRVDRGTRFGLAKALA